MPKPDKGSWDALGIDPENGDILVSVGYPDDKTRRFSTSGETVNSNWPVKAKSSLICTGRGGVWVGHGLFGFLPVPKISGLNLKPRDGFVPNYWTHDATGISKLSDGTVCVASAQGLVFFSASGVPLDRRIGGLDSISSLAVSSEGELLASCGDSSRFLRFTVDGAASSQLLCNSHEPWHTANGYSGKTLSFAWDRGDFLVLDATSKAVWSFDPNHTGWAEAPWKMLTDKTAFSKPRSLAAGDLLYWVLDDTRILEFNRFDGPASNVIESIPGLDLSKVKAISAATDKLLFLATSNSIVALRRDSKDDYSIAWQRDFSAVQLTAISSDSRAVAALFRNSGSLELYDAKTGSVLASVKPSLLPGGFDPAALCLSWPWLYAYDDFGKRIVRLKIERAGR